MTFSLHNYFIKDISTFFRTSYFSALLRTFPHFSVFHLVSLSLPSLVSLMFNLLSLPSLTSVSFSLVSPFLSLPYIGYYVTHFVTQTSVILYIPVISIYTWTLLAYFSSL